MFNGTGTKYRTVVWDDETAILLPQTLSANTCECGTRPTLSHSHAWHLKLAMRRSSHRDVTLRVIDLEYPSWLIVNQSGYCQKIGSYVISLPYLAPPLYTLGCPV